MNKLNNIIQSNLFFTLRLAGKITGMIKATGVVQMKELLTNPRELKKVIDEAAVMVYTF